MNFKMELINSLENNLQNKLVTNEKQNSFLETTIGKVINTGINFGLRTLLPDLIEDQVINIKDEILKNGFKSGLKQTISSVIDLGKSATGMITGKFENINQARTVIKSGGLMDTVSNLMDKGINAITKSGRVTKEIGNTIKNGKNVILRSIENNIQNNFDNQINSIEKINKYTNNWRQYYENRDFNGMEKEYNKIKEKLKEVMPIENTIINAKKLENLHTLIKNNGHNFNLSKEEIELANKLIA